MTPMNPPSHTFFKTAGRILNSGQARSVVLTGNIYDLFCRAEEGGADETYIPLIPCLTAQWELPGWQFGRIADRVRHVVEQSGHANPPRSALRSRTRVDVRSLSGRRCIGLGNKETKAQRPAHFRTDGQLKSAARSF